MPHRVFGIDLGAHSVKLAECTVGFRTAALTRLEVVGVEHDPSRPKQGEFNALGQLLTECAIRLTDPADVVVISYSGDRVLTRTYDVPFADEKKARAVIGSQIADDLPWELEDVVFDYTIERIGSSNRAVVNAAPSEEIEALLDALAQIGVKPWQIVPAPMSYATLLQAREPRPCVAVIDLGHLRTNIALVTAGHTLAARTISRGGHQLTEALQKRLQLSYRSAEQLKHREGGIWLQRPDSQAGAPPTVAAKLLGEAAKPLFEDIKRTISTMEARCATKPEKVFLTGGTSQLDGINDAIETILGTKAEAFPITGEGDLKVEPLGKDAEALCAVSLGIAFQHDRRRAINLRQGEFAFRTSTSVLREKLVPIAISLICILLFAGVSLYGSLHAIGKEQKKLRAQLERTTRQVFGKKISNGGAALRQLRDGAGARCDSIPEMTAVDVMQLLTDNLPPAEDAVLDVSRLEIKAGKLEMTATSNTRSAIGQIIESLKDVECFDEVTTGRISDVADGKKQFSVTLKTTCF